MKYLNLASSMSFKITIADKVVEIPSTYKRFEIDRQLSAVWIILASDFSDLAIDNSFKRNIDDKECTNLDFIIPQFHINDLSFAKYCIRFQEASLTFFKHFLVYSENHADVEKFNSRLSA